MKKRLNIFCVCMIAAFLLSVSGNVYLIIEMFVNGVEVGMKLHKEKSLRYLNIKWCTSCLLT